MFPRLFLVLSLLVPLFGCSSSEDEPGQPESPGPDASTEDLLPFLYQCVVDEDCASNLCFEFNNKGPHCTHGCTYDYECEGDSPGCNGKGVCKAPDGEGGGDGTGSGGGSGS